MVTCSSAHSFQLQKHQFTAHSSLSNGETSFVQLVCHVSLRGSPRRLATQMRTPYNLGTQSKGDQLCGVQSTLLAYSQAGVLARGMLHAL